jgi:uncharacterized repeat protein (TIGR03943 family)
MDDRTQGALLLAVGGICLRLGFTDAALAYVKAGMQPLLVATGLVLIGLGVGSLRRAFRGPEPGEVATDDLGTTDHAAMHGYVAEFAGDGGAVEVAAEAAHDHAHGPAVAWLLVAPLLALLLIAPPALGSFAAGRQSARPPVTDQTTYPPLPAMEAGAVPLPMTEFVFRALYDPDRSLEGARIRLSGFVTPVEDGEGYFLSRFTMNCCAADATAVNVRIVEDGVREADTWLEVEGRWQPNPGADPDVAMTEPPAMRAESVTVIPAPVQPYEY